MLNLLWGLPALALLLYAPGAVVLNLLSARSPYAAAFSGRDEWLFTALLISALTTSLVGFVLAQVGFFSWWLLLLLVLAGALAGAFLLGELRRPADLLRLLRFPSPPTMRVTDRRDARLRLALLVIIMVGAAALYARPAEMLRGALDAGVYVNSGVAIGRTGSILQSDTLMRQLNDDAGEGRELMQSFNPDRYTFERLRLPGFYVFDKKAALVLPQHYSLFPVWIGLMYSLFGVWGALYAQPLLALLALLAFYYFARRVLSPGASLLALALLALCPVVIWFARYPISEVLTLFLAFSAFYAFHRMITLTEQTTDNGDDSKLKTQNSKLWGVLAGASLGLMSLARPDFFLYLIPLLPYVAYWRLARRWRPAYTGLLITLGAFLALYVVHFFFFTFGYTVDLYYNVIQDTRRRWAILIIALYAGAALLILADRFLSARSRQIALSSKQPEPKANSAFRVWAGLLALLVGGYALYHYAVAPWLPNLRLDKAGNPIPQEIPTTLSSYTGGLTDEGGRYNLLRIGWYVSPLGIALGVGGLMRWVWGRLGAASGLFFGSLLLMGLVFLPETYTEAHYIYTMRRYLPVILPALILGIAWACHFLWTAVRPRFVGWALGAGAAAAMFTFYIATSTNVIIPHVEYQGAVAQFTDLANRFNVAPRSVVLFSQERDQPSVVATPLQYIFGIDSWVINRPYSEIHNDVLDGIVKRWESQGYKVWVMMGANGGKLDLPGYSLQEEGYWEYAVPEFEQLHTQKPYNTYRTNLPWGIYSVQPRAATPPPQLPFSLNIGDMDYPHLVAGFHTEEATPQDRDKWRWTGPTAILRVPWPTTTISNTATYDGAIITLRARQESFSERGPARPPAPLPLKLYLDDTPIGEIAVAPGPTFYEYTLRVPPGVLKRSPGIGTALLRIDSPTWSPKEAGAGGDERVLGVQLDALEINLP